MTTSPSLPVALEVGWLNLDEIEGCRVLEEPQWFARNAKWYFPVELTCDIPSSLVPASTWWFVVADADYPAGRVEVYPALAGGLRVTFPHQSHNGTPERGRPWREGNICLTVPWTEGKRRDRASPPRAPERRLRWTLERAHEWLTRAATGRLVAPGDPYELPDFGADTTDELGLIVVPGLASTAHWLQRARPAWGIAACRTLRPAGRASRVTVIRELRPDPLADSDPLHTPWGTLLSEASGTDHYGAWLWLPAPPRLLPWQAPQTWGELRGWAKGAGIDLEPPLGELCARFRTRTGTVVLVGFPIPIHFAGPFEQIAWQALRLPPLRTRARLPVRLRERPLSELDRAGPLADAVPLQWLATKIWSRDHLAVRGVADPALQSLRITILGVGAVGARLAELLVRAGVRRLHLIDGDTIEAGNLVRHTMTLHALGVPKAIAVRDSLQAASPHAELTADPSALSASPTDASAQLGDADLVIDATASDEVLRTLAVLASDQPRLWASLSLNRHAERIYCFLAHAPCFPLETFEQSFEPWRKDDAHRHEDALPWEGPGCWSPVFPARVDDITALVALAVRELEQLVLHPPIDALLRVYERRHDKDGRSIEIRHRELTDSPGTGKNDTSISSTVTSTANFTPGLVQY